MNPMKVPIICATWSFGRRANNAAWPALQSGGSALDAVETAARDAESDPANHTVGTGGFTDASGRVSLDAAIMLSPARHGAVACVRDVEHPITLARRVMEQTPHRLLVGPDAEQFARDQGMPAVNLLTDDAARAYVEWSKTRQPLRLANLEDQIAHRNRAIGEQHHDTIGVLALDRSGTLAAACTTSGLAYKMPGRVGDSPIVGSGLYCDPKIGAVVCTGRGELVQGVCGSILAIEAMRNGRSTRDAIRQTLERMAETHELGDDDQVGMIILRPDGTMAAGSLMKGFLYSVRSCDRDETLEPTLILGGS
jgi:N4-(beta-N-acetylglucosaminyl)-L-asparaginase